MTKEHITNLYFFKFFGKKEKPIKNALQQFFLNIARNVYQKFVVII